MPSAQSRISVFAACLYFRPQNKPLFLKGFENAQLARKKWPNQKWIHIIQLTEIVQHGKALFPLDAPQQCSASQQAEHDFYACAAAVPPLQVVHMYVNDELA